MECITHVRHFRAPRIWLDDNLAVDGDEGAGAEFSNHISVV